MHTGALCKTCHACYIAYLYVVQEGTTDYASSFCLTVILLGLAYSVRLQRFNATFNVNKF